MSNPSVSSRARRLAAILALAALAMVPACSKKGGGVAPPPPGSAQATITGFVISSTSGLPVAGVTISSTPAAAASVTTNSAGIFSLAIPANSLVSVDARHPGFAARPAAVNVGASATQSMAVALVPIGTIQGVATAAGGVVTHLAAKTRLELPAGFASGTVNAQVSVTGLDPTSAQMVAIPGTTSAENLFGATANLEPVALANIRLTTSTDAPLALLQPATIELTIPTSLLADPRITGSLVIPCLRYDEARGVWRAFADAQLTSSAVGDGHLVARCTIPPAQLPHGEGWICAGFLNGSSSCVQGVVTSLGVPVANVTVQAFPGGTDQSESDGSYRVSVPVSTAARVVASRILFGSSNVVSVGVVGGTAGGGCVAQNLVLPGVTGPPSYTVYAQLNRGRDAFNILRDEVHVRILVQFSGPPTAVSGAEVELNDGAGWIAVPQLSPGVYGIVSGSPAPFTLKTGATYTLRVDFQPDGTFDATSTVMMPGKPVLTAPTNGSMIEASVVTAWDDLGVFQLGYGARYLGFFEHSIVPQRFLVLTPGNSYEVGTGVGQPQYRMHNDPIEGGEHIIRLWATNGSIRYATEDTVLFTTPNIVAPNVTGWFGAIAQAESIRVTSLGGGPKPSAVATRAGASPRR